jgi:hypothetical protein
MWSLVLTLVSPGFAADVDVAKYTVMVFMNGSDLESEGGAATDDLLEMQEIGSDASVNVVVETLGTAAWNTEGISNEENQRWLVTPGGMELLMDGLGNRPLADSDTLTDFIVWTQQNFPAEKYALIFWDHGGGSVTGYGSDELAEDGETSLSLAGIEHGIAAAVAETGETFELVGFDTCLLATVEMASLLSPYADYMVASEEVEPGHGWNYTPVLKSLVGNPAITGDKLGRVIADGFRAQANEQGTGATITLSVTDLSKVPAVVSALEALVKAGASGIGDVERLNALFSARSRAESYGGDSDMVDLGDLVKGLVSAYPKESQALLKAIDSAVVYKITSKGLPKATGLSIYYPYKGREFLADSLEMYDTVPFSEAYKEFVASYAELILADTTAPTFTEQPAAEASGEDEEGDWTSYGASVDAVAAGEIAEVYSVLAMYSEDDEETILFLGMDNDVDFDAETGEIDDTFNGAIVMLNDNPVSMFIENSDEDVIEYRIPVRLNGRSADLIVLYEYDTEAFEVVGAWPGINHQTGMAAKEIIEVKKGDKITPVFFAYNYETDEDSEYEGDTFVVKNELTVDYAELPEGEYLYGFYVIDYAQNESVSDFVDVVITADGEEVSVGDRGLGDDEIKVVVNGKRLIFDVAPEKRNNRTLVPLRAIFEALGAEVGWNGETNSITATLGGTVIELQVDNPVVRVNGKPMTLDQAPVLSGGRTLVPARFAGEALGAKVEWDEATQTVLITSAK